MTVISDYVFMSSFLCQAFHAVQKETAWSVHFHVLHSRCFADQHTLHFLICTFSLFIMKQQQKLSSFIYAKENDSWTWKAWSKIVKLTIVVQSFNIIVWPRPFLKLIQFKMPRGTYDPLLPISRLNSLLNNTHHKPCFNRIS